MKQLTKMGAEPSLLDPKVINAPIITQPMHFMSDEYNSTLPPGLTNILDYFPLNIYRHKPASIVTYSMGPFGGARAQAMARPFLSELGMVTLPSVVALPQVQNAGIAEDGETENERILKSTEKVVKELVWYINAITSQAESSGGNPN